MIQIQMEKSLCEIQQLISKQKPCQEWQICGVQVAAFLQLLLMAFLYLHPDKVNISHVLRAILSVTC